MSVESERLASDPAWRRWGPYLAERAWGTVREDYSANGDAWQYFPHEHARSRVYRWNEDGLLGFCDDQQRLCFALALWNGRDPILKERLFGLSNPEGNHGEDVKEYYYYLDSTPTHSYLKALYKYPQAAFPYDELIRVNRARQRDDPEYELLHTGVFDHDRYFDVFVEYAKAFTRDILVLIRAHNRGPDPAELHLVPTLWFRNTWSWERDDGSRPTLRRGDAHYTMRQAIVSDHRTLGRYVLSCGGDAELLFTDNETNVQRLYGVPNASRFVKDAFHDCIVHGRGDAVNPAQFGTKAAAHYQFTLNPGERATVRLRLTNPRFHSIDEPFHDFDTLFAQRRAEADEFYRELQPPTLTDDERLVQRQAFAGMLWSKQYYCYSVERWLEGDPVQPPPSAARRDGRNSEWRHLNNADVLSMPDKWEYPWYAAWDLAFHCITLALLDPEFAKNQLVLLGREWYQHPNGQMPAYEWGFGDANPPVLAWATWRVYKIEQKHSGKADRAFLERMYHKLLLNFTWWVNRKDSEGNNVFQGGFLGLDNIGVFDRNTPMPNGGRLEQSDGTSWMGMFCLNMMTIALELAIENKVYEDIATKFFEHFLYIAEAMNNIGDQCIPLWNEDDEFFYDVLHFEHANLPLKIRSMVGLIPLFAVTTIEPSLLNKVPQFKGRLEWFLRHRSELAQLVSRWTEPRMGERRLLAILRGHRMKRVIRRLVDPNEFLSDYGVRALSRYHLAHPFMLDLEGQRHEVSYQPGESSSGLFGGNSNWRGPIWLPVNFLIIESLQQFHHYYGDDFKIECPTGSGQFITIHEIADELSRRLMSMFLRDRHGRRAIFGDEQRFQTDPHWRDYIPFYEYFHGDTGAGLGASHQTGWTGLIAKLIQQQGEHRAQHPRSDNPLGAPSDKA